MRQIMLAIGLAAALAVAGPVSCASRGGDAPPATIATQVYEVQNNYVVALEIVEAAVYDARVPDNIKVALRRAVAEASTPMRNLRTEARTGTATVTSLSFTAARSALDRVEQALRDGGLFGNYTARLAAAR